jgi:hypothetical protein
MKLSNMKLKQLPGLPAQSLLYLLICAGGIIGFFLLAIHPYHKYLADLDRKIKTIEAQMEAQKRLFPLYKDLLKKVSITKKHPLPFPRKDKFDREKTDEISNIFEEMARKSNLSPVNIVPDVTSLVQGSGLLSISLRMKGDFFQFRDFLTRLGGMPFLEHIEEIQIQPAGEIKEFGMKVWIALETSEQGD